MPESPWEDLPLVGAVHVQGTSSAAKVGVTHSEMLSLDTNLHSMSPDQELTPFKAEEHGYTPAAACLLFPVEQQKCSSQGWCSVPCPAAPVATQW